MPLISTLIAQLPSSINGASNASMSADGRWVAFLGADSHGNDGLFLEDLSSGAINQLSIPGDFLFETAPTLSADASKLAFLAGRDLAGTTQAYVLDLHTNQLQLASSDAHGVAADSGAIDRISLSGDGKYMVFSSNAKNFLAGNNNGITKEVYLKDLTTGALSLVSSSAHGIVADASSWDAQISRDGKSVVFASFSGNLLAGASSGTHLFIKDLASGGLRFGDTDANGILQGVLEPGTVPMLSADSHKLAYGVQGLIYVKDLQTGNLILATTATDGKALAGYCQMQAISADGRYITFTSSVGLVLPGDADIQNDVYQKDLQTGTLQLLTPHASRTGQSGGAVAAAASDDGHSVLFASQNPTVFGNGSERGPYVSINNALYVSHTNGLPDNHGIDAVIGTSGADQLIGGNGNDSYWIDNSGDQIIETSGGGIDTALSLVDNYHLADNVENLVLGLTADANVAMVVNASGSGNDLNNQIFGNAQNNILRGMGGDDVIIGGGGDDTIDGGTGFDIALFNTSRAASTISHVAGGIQVSSAEGVDLLQNVERIQFSDQGFALPGDTHAAQAYRIYQAAFNRTPDAGGLGFWIKQIDNGATLDDVAHGFMQSAEFKGLYGTNPANATLVEKFYQNVLHRAPDAGGFQYWTDLLDRGIITPQHTLEQFSESPENQAALTGVVNAGFAFTLFN